MGMKIIASSGVLEAVGLGHTDSYTQPLGFMTLVLCTNVGGKNSRRGSHSPNCQNASTCFQGPNMLLMEYTHFPFTNS